MIALSLPKKFRPSLWASLIFIIFILLFLSELSTEVKISNYIYSSLTTLTLLSVSSLDLAQRKLVAKILKNSALLLAFASVFFIMLNIVNVYELVSTKSVVSFCLSNTISCELIKETFFRFKIYRFITLSTSFFSWLVLVIGLNWYVLNKNKTKVLKGNSRLATFFIIYVVIILISQSKGIVAGLYSTLIKVPQYISTPYPDRFVVMMKGNNYFGWIYTYTKFIAEHSPEEATILIPPQRHAWEMEGNAGYVRWFLYPRYVRSSSDLSPVIPDDVKFVMISHGTWWSKIHGWPQIEIPAEKIKKIWLINRQTLDQEELGSGNYQYKEGEELWGLIELK